MSASLSSRAEIGLISASGQAKGNRGRPFVPLLAPVLVAAVLLAPVWPSLKADKPAGETLSILEPLE